MGIGALRRHYPAPPADPEFPEGAPSEDWTVKQLKAWAKVNEVDLGEAKSKPEILAVVAIPPAPNPAPPADLAG